jgi:NADH-quinone oxidoreductase subunit M
VGEFLALLGAFERYPIAAGVAATGVIFAAYYMLPMVQRIWYGRLDRDENRSVPDLSGREIAVLAPMLALMIWIGVQPAPILRRLEPAVEAVLEHVETADVQAGPGLLPSDAAASASTASPNSPSGL